MHKHGLPKYLKITKGDLKHFDPSYFRQTTAYDEMTPVMNWAAPSKFSIS